LINRINIEARSVASGKKSLRRLELTVKGDKISPAKPKKTGGSKKLICPHFLERYKYEYFG
jgi:hypothetical protein